MNEATEEKAKVAFWGLLGEEPHAVTEWKDLPPRWRGTQTVSAADVRGQTYFWSQNEIDAVNAAIYLRRPLLVTGRPGVGKSSLAHAIAHKLGLGDVLVWSISTKSTLKEGLYQYDAIGRLQSAKDDPGPIDDFLTLGALGTALHPENPCPRVLLIDEIDKSDVDLPNDLLAVLEEGAFDIPELQRIQSKQSMAFVDGKDRVKRWIEAGRVEHNPIRYPVIVLTSNGERDFPAPFLRRCIRVTVEGPGQKQLEEITLNHFNRLGSEELKLIKEFLEFKDDRATDQLLNAIFLLADQISVPEDRHASLREMLFQRLTSRPT